MVILHMVDVDEDGYTIGDSRTERKTVEWFYKWFPWFIEQHPEAEIKYGKDYLHDGKYLIQIQFTLWGVVPRSDPNQPRERWTIYDLSKKAINKFLDFIGDEDKF